LKPAAIGERHGIGGTLTPLFTFFADAVLIRPFIAELAHAETAPP
jgi:hypothetical protein